MQHMTDEERDYYERTRKPVLPVPTTRRGRLTMGVLVLFWFAILLLPCAFFALAINGDITFQHRSVPEPESHPFFQANLIMDVDNRGLQFTRSVIYPETESNTCVQTHINYLLWETSDEGDLSVVYCDCYERADTESIWQLAQTETALCQP